MPLLLPSKERSSLIRFFGFDLRVRCAAAHLLVTTSNAIIAVLDRTSEGEGKENESEFISNHRACRRHHHHHSSHFSRFHQPSAFE
ncbi:hypothetical protein HN51_045214 [Arachis hypogaea]